MMNEIITINQSNNRFPISARELYDKLGFDKSNWAKWHKINIAENKFAIEHQDFEGFVLTTNGNQTQDYQLSLDFAKRFNKIASFR